jgi:ribonuclease HI
MANRKFYVVWKGRVPGIYETWDACSEQITGYSGAEYKSFLTRTEAEKAYSEAYEEYKGKKPTTYTPETLALIGKPIADSYSVDASCIGNPGIMEYRCVHTTSGEVLFKQGPYENGTNNIGEFLAIVHALALFQKREINLPIYTDSETALNWVKIKKCKTKLPQDDKNEKIFELISRAEDWLLNHEVTTTINKWDTNAWGEIPADYGRK